MCVCTCVCVCVCVCVRARVWEGGSGREERRGKEETAEKSSGASCGCVQFAIVVTRMDSSSCVQTDGVYALFCAD